MHAVQPDGFRPMELLSRCYGRQTILHLPASEAHRLRTGSSDEYKKIHISAKVLSALLTGL